MASDGTSEAAKKGKNELLIHIDHNSGNPGRPQVFHPGQVVAGKVIYHIRKEQDELRDAAISFTGKMQTRVTVRNGNNSRVEKETIGLFTFRKTLHQGEFMMRAQTMTWPFEFKFPDSVRYIRGLEPEDGYSHYASDGEQPLPPTFDFFSGSFSKNGSCYVRYMLKAEINACRTFHSKTAEMHLPLVRALGTPLPDPITMFMKLPRSSWQSRTLREHKHTFSQKMTHVFKNDPNLRNPSINFDATLQMPRKIALGQRTDMILCLTQVRLGPTDPEGPKLVLGDVRIMLQHLTTFRVAATWTVFRDNWHDEGKGISREGTFKARADGEQKALPLDGTPTIVARNWSLSDLRVGVGRTVPDFNTWTISHQHNLKVEMQIVHPDSGHAFKVETKFPCMILPTDVLLPQSDAIQSNAPLPQKNPDEVEQLPLYSANPGPSDLPPPPPMSAPVDAKIGYN